MRCIPGPARLAAPPAARLAPSPAHAWLTTSSSRLRTIRRGEGDPDGDPARERRDPARLGSDPAGDPTRERRDPARWRSDPDCDPSVGDGLHETGSEEAKWLW